MRINLDSVFFFVGQAVARHMIARRRGKIINIDSLKSEAARYLIAPYTASKGAVKNLIKGMCADWARRGLQINAIGPFYFATPLNHALADNAEFDASFIVGVLVPIGHMDGARAERWVGAVVDALPAFGSRAAAKVRRCSRSRESYCFHHVQAIMLTIDQYAESALGNRQYFLNKPHSIGGKNDKIP